MKENKFKVSRRLFMKIGLASGAATIVGTGALRPDTLLAALPPMNDRAKVIEKYPTSPFIVEPFQDLLPQPQAMLKGWRRPDGSLDPNAADAWTVRRSAFLAGPDNPTGAGVVPPGPGLGQQDAYGFIPAGGMATNAQGEVTHLHFEHPGTHQIWPQPGVGPNAANFDRLLNWPATGIEPDLYHIRMQWGPHSFTTSRVIPIRKGGRPLRPRDINRLNAARAAANPPVPPIELDADGFTSLPPSTVWGFNGTFPGPMINGEYGKPAIVRFENDLDFNPLALDGQNFGAPDLAFLTHQHNGHTAPESDGNPFHMQVNEGGYTPADWFDALYLGYPAGGDPQEIQTFLWFHDHRMHHTGSNVYKGMVGLFPMYDTGIPTDDGGIVPGSGLDTGNESDPAPNLGIPGVKRVNADGTFNVDYDIPFAIYDVTLDDGDTRHRDMHTPNFPANLPSAAVPGIRPDEPGATHPEWWGKSFYKHFPNHGFVGDIFTVNGVAFPLLNVEPRPYRFRFLGASVARVYELTLMTSGAGPVPRPGTAGQWQIPDGEVWMNPAATNTWTAISSMGGLLPNAVGANSFHIWPADRMEFVVDFTGIAPGTEIYLTNILRMDTGRKPAFNKFLPNEVQRINRLKYKVPLVKIVVGELQVPFAGRPIVPGTELRPMPLLADLVNRDGRPSLTTGVSIAATAGLPRAEFVLKKSGKFGLENSWLINKTVFNHEAPLYNVRRNQPEVWTTTNGGGGWVHPMHMHQEEHTILSREGSVLPFHIEDTGRADVANLEPGESVTFYRNFRTFEGRYVAHCHNLAHEDHGMMFGWTLLPPDAPDDQVGFQEVPDPVR